MSPIEGGLSGGGSPSLRERVELALERCEGQENRGGLTAKAIKDLHLWLIDALILEGDTILTLVGWLERVALAAEADAS